MRASVRNAFVGFTSPLEGVLPFLYLDVKGLVTVAIGNLVDPIEAALSLPLMRPDGMPATRGEIADAWRAVKARQDLAQRGGLAFRNVTTLRLTTAGIERVVFAKLDLFDRQLTVRFPGYPEWPADAQLATLSMSWACGAHFRFPSLVTALNTLDFERAAMECSISEKGNPGVKPRNVHNRLMYRNAARALAQGADPDQLFWPAELGATGELAPETEPNPVPTMRPPPPSHERIALGMPPPSIDFDVVRPRVPLVRADGVPIVHDDDDQEDTT
jgi:GH24 family phage-related lysozyme (muramidase)